MHAMNNLFLALFLISILLFVIGLIKPSLIRQKSRLRAAGFSSLCIVLFFILFGITTGPVSSQSPSTTAVPSASIPAKKASLGTSPVMASDQAPSSSQTVPQQNTPQTPAAGALSLITEPDAGVAPVVSMIQGATKSVDLIMYELEDTQVEQALVAAKARGVSVRVLLNPGYYGKQETANQSAYGYLQAQDVSVQWTPSYFALTHQKTLVVDGTTAMIMTFNLTPKYYSTSRDFGVIDTDPVDVAAIESAFTADWQGTKTTAAQGDDLVWSPGSQSALVSLISGATSSLQVYNEEMSDQAVITALEAAAGRGVNVEVDMTYSSDWASAFAALSAAGVHVRTYAADVPLYIHAKMILADDSTAFVGSENFSAGSLNDNRELGIVTSDSGVISSLSKTFFSDWVGAAPFIGSTSSSSSSSGSSSGAAFYLSSYYTAHEYYPASCLAWESLSRKYLKSFDSLQDLLAAYPGRTLSQECD